MGNSADRAWQLSQLVEGVSTAFNPSHGSLSYVQAGHCVSKQIGRHDAACQGCPRCVSRSPEARCLRVFARAVRFSQPAVLSALLAIQLFGIVIPPPILPLKSTKRSAATILGRSAPSLLFHGALRNILLPAGFPATIHMIELEQTFANDSLQKISLAAAASESNRFYPVFLPHNHFYGAPGAGAAADLQDGRRVAVYLCGRDAEPCHEHLLFCEISKYVAGIKSK